ncbi:MAG: putative porin [Winogradskyella sp.]|uniref:putative porin n=1 Tax=Winogradskyella sp. TaxID=1883156 RepID=UPI001851A793|nr:putative porin [Winogradskyella sp.]
MQTCRSLIKHSACFLFLFASLSISAQKKLTGRSGAVKGDPSLFDSSTVKRSTGYKEVASIDMYLQFNEASDSIIVDTTLSIKKLYKFNYLQKDNFGLMPFANIGQTYNSLTFNPFQKNTTPRFAAQSRHFNYLEVEDINYYEVPTPWTRLTYKTAFEQGQLLDAFFTVNLSKQFNFSIAYKGLRSLGNYQNALTSTGNFRFTSNYNSKNKRYQARGHIVMQDLLNQENAGLTEEGVVNFQSGDEEFIDRSIFDPNLEDAENILEGRRFVLEQSYNIVKRADSLKATQLSVFNHFNFEDKYYQYYEGSLSTDFFGDVFTNKVDDKVTLEDFRTNLGLLYKSRLIGEMSFAVNYNSLNYGYNTTVLFPSEIIPNRIKQNFFGVEARFKKTFKSFSISGEGALNISDAFSGNFISGNLKYVINDKLSIAGGINASSRLANYNLLLYQSDYINYNWYNAQSFENVRTQQLYAEVDSKEYVSIHMDVSNIDNFTYFNLESTIDKNKIIKPRQYSKPIQYLRLKAQKEFKFGNFALDNTILYQNVISDQSVLNVPDFTIRNTFYYTNELFKKAMTLQTGVSLNYFTSYNMNGYDPLLAEFYTQNETEIGGFPMLDFFVSAKVRQTRIFLSAEHFNSSFTGYDYFSAPNHPYRDFTIRFGLVWDFFL